jgi:hypothetical protein
MESKARDEKHSSRSRNNPDKERQEIMLTVLLFRFPFKGPWGQELTDAAHGLARDIADEDELVWKIWLENRDTNHAGGVYLFADAAAAERYREKHERRLAAIGLTGVTAHLFSVNTELSVLTLAEAALGDVRVAVPS